MLASHQKGVSVDRPKQSVIATIKERIKAKRNDGIIGVLFQVREDYWVHDSELLSPGLHALAAHRFGVWQRGLPVVLRAPLGVLHRMLYWYCRYLYGIELPVGTVVGRRVRISHQSGIVIHPDAKIGDECRIRQNVTIGAATHHAQAPVLGNRVEIGAGAVIVGNVVVGDDARIGPNTVVTSNVPPGATVFAPAPRIIQMPKRPKPAEIANAAEQQGESHDTPGFRIAARPEAEPAEVTRRGDVPQLSDVMEPSSRTSETRVTSDR